MTFHFSRFPSAVFWFFVRHTRSVTHFLCWNPIDFEIENARKIQIKSVLESEHAEHAEEEAAARIALRILLLNENIWVFV